MVSSLIGALLVATVSTRAHHPHRGAPKLAAPPAAHPVVAARKLGPEPGLSVHDPVLGAWRGAATARGARLDLGLRILLDGGGLAGELTCADFLLLDQPLARVHRTPRGIAFDTADESPLHVEATLAGDTLRGTATLPAVPGVEDPGGAEPIAIQLVRSSDPPALPPYSRRDLTIAAPGARLAATLLLPANAAVSPGVVLLPGSSANVRRDSRFYADLFARAGFAVLLFDKRGSGESEGDYGAATYEELVGDATAAVETLRRSPGVDSSRVGLWGLSQGAFLAPFVARRVPALQFVVAVSAPGLPIGECATYQDSVRLAAAGFDAADVRRATTLDRRLYEWLQGGGSTPELSALLAEAAPTPWRRASSLPAMLPAGRALDSWYWRGRTLDPSAAWHDVRVPVLALYGAADELMPARANARAVERALRAGHDRDVTVKTLPAANHVMRRLPLAAGGRWDWPRVTPGYLELVTAWMQHHAQPAAVAETR